MSEISSDCFHCVSFDLVGFRHAMTMAFAIEEINRNFSLLPNVTLGYSLYDNCATLVIGFSAALSMVSGQEEQFLLQENCLGTPPVLGIVGDSFSTFSIATSDVIGLFKLPIVSFTLVTDQFPLIDHEACACFILGELFCHVLLPE